MVRPSVNVAVASWSGQLQHSTRRRTVSPGSGVRSPWRPEVAPIRPEEEPLARRVRRRSTGGTRTATRAAAPQALRAPATTDNEGIIPVLARAVREVEAAVAARPRDAVRCARSSRSSRCWCARSAPGSRPTRACTEAQRAEQLKRLDGIATILAKTAARDTSLLALLAEDAVVSDAASDAQARDAARRRASSAARGARSRREPAAAAAPPSAGWSRSRCVSRQLANPFLAPDFSTPRRAPAAAAPAGRLGAARPAVHARSSTPAAARRRAWRCPSRRRRCARPAASS